MSQRYLTCLIISFLAIFFNFSAAAVHVAARETYIPGPFEQARRAKAMIDEDKKLMDGALQKILKMLKQKADPAVRLPLVANLLQELITIHNTEELNTKERQEKLNLVRELAEGFSPYFHQMEENNGVPDLSIIEDDPEIDEAVKIFLKDYFKGLYHFERVGLQASAAILLGPSVGCGLARLTFLSGERWLGLSPSIGWANVSPATVRDGVPMGGDVSLECTQGTSSSCATSSSRFHGSAGLGLVFDIENRNQRHADLRMYELKGCKGISAGLGIMEVNSWSSDLRMLPLPSSYNFVRERLGIVYGETSPQTKQKDS